MSSAPPFTITPALLGQVAEIAGELGRLGALEGIGQVPRLRRENRIRSIHASLAIEQNTLSLEQMTAVIAGQRVLGAPREIREVRNAFTAYEAMGGWKPWSLKDLLAAHRLLLDGLAEDAGKLRTRGVGVAKGGVLVHLAPPAAGVAGLMRDLLGWLKKTDVHPLVAGSVCHYELEFIHPFSDGNGRIGRLWQTLILSRWDPLLGFLPVESVVRERQDEYYRILAVCDKAGNSTAFIEFMLGALLAALRDARRTDQVGDQVSDQVSEQVSEQVKGLLGCLVDGPRSARECMDRLGLCHRPTFRANYLNPALAAGLIELTVPDKPRSRLQQYRLARNRT